MLKVCTLIAASWDEITPKTLQLSWRKILNLKKKGTTDKKSTEEKEGEDQASTGKATTHEASNNEITDKATGSSAFQALSVN